MWTITGLFFRGLSDDLHNHPWFFQCTYMLSCILHMVQINCRSGLSLICQTVCPVFLSITPVNFFKLYVYQCSAYNHLYFNEVVCSEECRYLNNDIIMIMGANVPHTVQSCLHWYPIYQWKNAFHFHWSYFPQQQPQNSAKF